MGALAEIILSFLTLMEAEGRALRVGIARLAVSLVFTGLFCVLLVTGMGLIVWALYLYLRLGLNAPTAALLDGIITIFIAGVVGWIARVLVR